MYQPNEIDPAAFLDGAQFCVYVHKRPDGTAFYVGKGLRKRAHDFAPSRRTAWHKNVVAKYGRAAIAVEVFPCSSEFEALLLEKVHIAMRRSLGDELVNLTDGGEGRAGHTPSPAQLVGLAKGRMKGKRGKPGRRPELETWINSDAGQAHIASLGARSAAWLLKPRTIICAECGCESEVRSPKAKCCTRKCEQRYRRAGKNK